MSTPDPEAPKLDPKPWRCIWDADRFVHEQTSGKHVTTFKPRPQYSQRREDYPNA